MSKKNVSILLEVKQELDSYRSLLEVYLSTEGMPKRLSYGELFKILIDTTDPEVIAKIYAKMVKKEK